MELGFSLSPPQLVVFTLTLQDCSDRGWSRGDMTGGFPLTAENLLPYYDLIFLFRTHHFGPRLTDDVRRTQDFIFQ